MPDPSRCLRLFLRSWARLYLYQLHYLRLFRVRVRSQMLGLSPHWRPNLWSFLSQLFDTPPLPASVRHAHSCGQASRHRWQAPTVSISYDEFTKQPTTSDEPFHTLNVTFQSEPMVAEVECGVQSSNVTLKDNKAVCEGLTSVTSTPLSLGLQGWHSPLMWVCSQLLYPPQ